MSTELVYLGQIVIAIILGAMVGWQRERRGKAAGTRTYSLVTAGAALFTILSLNAFPGADAARVASQIVVGIGFLGAGTILHREKHVEGLTTAAGLWMAAAVGMAVGAEYYLLAAASTALVLSLLIFDDQKMKKTPDRGEEGK